MTKAQRFEGCIIGGAIGDAWGSGYENQFTIEEDTYYLFGNPMVRIPKWEFTDDTQLTLATVEEMMNNSKVTPGLMAQQFLKYYRQGRLRGIGASTLKALRELNFGGHWSQVGRRGEYAAGNGAAMRIAPIAFREQMTNSDIRDICIITHHNEEAYIGARSVVIAIRSILRGEWTGKNNLLDIIIDQIPDTRVRDRLIEIRNIESLMEIGQFGRDGYVVNSVPLAIAAANKVSEYGIEKMYSQLIEIGGDTDTNCSIAGQIAGTLVGIDGIPKNLMDQLSNLFNYKWLHGTVKKFIESEGWE